MTPRPNKPTTKTLSFSGQIYIKASCEQVFAALTTIDAIRAWWTSTATGLLDEGCRFRVDFMSVDEYIIMSVLEVDVPQCVVWECIERRGPQKIQPDEWQGSRIVFEVVSRGPGKCMLAVQHIGVNAEGWNHFLYSIKQYIETGTGTPFDCDE